jgi:hypothetical protein
MHEHVARSFLRSAVSVGALAGLLVACSSSGGNDDESSIGRNASEISSRTVSKRGSIGLALALGHAGCTTSETDDVRLMSVDTAALIEGTRLPGLAISRCGAAGC